VRKLGTIILAIAAATAVVAAEELPRQAANAASCPSPPKIDFPVGGVTSFVMRRVNGPDGAVDFRILGSHGQPAILSLIAPDRTDYADYTYNGHDADLDVSRGGLNLRPLDGRGSVNVWSLTGNARLRVGSENFRQSVDLWHDGENAHVRTTAGNVIVESPLETASSATLGGDTVVTGKLRLRERMPERAAAGCQRGEIEWDERHLWVCTNDGN
jgi:hypothetical protein